jgi:hypothetical protein
MGPIVFGWIGLAIVASGSHLVPAIGPGDPPAHARQRATLGRAASLRLGLIDMGVAATSVGLMVCAVGRRRLAMVVASPPPPGRGDRPGSGADARLPDRAGLASAPRDTSAGPDRHPS